MFGGFWPDVLLTLVILAVLASPLFFIARREGRTDTIKRFLIGGAVIVALVATLAFVSDRNIEQCFNAGNRGCVDAGTTGLQMMLVGGYVVTAWWVSWVIANQ